MNRISQSYLRSLFLKLSAALFVASLASAAEPLFNSATVWQDRENDIAVHFVYALTQTPRGTLLTFAEARIGTGHDEGPHHIVLKRSVDRGASWSKSIVIERSDGSYWREQGQRVRPECWTNPAVVTERSSGRVFIFYALNEGEHEGKNQQRFTRSFYRTSDDEGITWSDRVEVTDLLNTKADGSPNKDSRGEWVRDANGFPCDYLGRAFHMPGPGHGLQLKSGRLLMQFWNRTAVGTLAGPIPREKRNYGLRLLYSDDGGRTWTTGPAFGEGLGPTESRIVELDDGSLYLNARSDNVELKTRPRAIFDGSNGGLTWRFRGYDSAMPAYVALDSGLTSFHHQGRQVLLFSHPRDTEKRMGLTLSVSFDAGRSWTMHKRVHDEGSNYSDMVVLDDGTIGLLYGNGPAARDGFPVKFIRFDLAWLGL